MVNLIKDSWIPVVTKSGDTLLISPAGIIRNDGVSDPVRLDTCRADFNSALIQFLIGLVQARIPPANSREWRRSLLSPPSPGVLRDAFSAIEPYFEMTGTGPCFMQDMSLPEVGLVPIGRLLLEMPGENAEKNNTDHFLKRGTVGKICLPCAAMVLYTLQSFASFGGAGHRTGLRGGGPLTTIVEGRNLWETIWLNILENEKFLALGNAAKIAPRDTFPWLGALKPASKDETCTPATVHPAQMFFAVPRRIRLLPEEDPGCTCDLCGMKKCTTVVRSYVTENGGINYKGGWRHTLTPYYADKKTGELLPVHAQPGGLAYHNMAGILFENPESRTIPAINVHEFVHLRYEEISSELGEMVPLWVSGYDMDKAKARCYYEHHMPVLHVKPEVIEDYATLIRQLIGAADLSIFNIRRCVRKAMFDEHNKASGDISYINASFWHDTEPGFYMTLSSALALDSEYDKTIPLREEWVKILAREGMMLFDQYAQSDMIAYANPKRIALARKDLRFSLSDTNKKVRELLDLPKPEPKDSVASKTKARKSTTVTVLEES